MEGFNPGQAFLMATTRPDLEDESYRRARELNDGTDYRFPKEFPTGPKPGTDPLTGMPLPLAQVPLFGGAGNKVMDFLNRVDIAGMPRYIRGVPAPSGVINRAPHIDSPYIDEQIRRGWKPIQLTAPGPQLPGFV